MIDKVALRRPPRWPREGVWARAPMLPVLFPGPGSLQPLCFQWGGRPVCPGDGASERIQGPLMPLTRTELTGAREGRP